MSNVFSQIGFWEHIRQPLDLNRENLKISFGDQKRKLLIQSLFSGATVTLLTSMIRTKPFTPTAKSGFVLFAAGVTGATFLLLTLVLKTERIYVEINRIFSELIKENQALKEGQVVIEEIKKKNLAYSNQVQDLENALLKFKKPQAMEQVAEICGKRWEENLSNESEACEKMVTLIQEYELNVNVIFEWGKDKQATFLTIASEHESHKIILKLLELGADPAHKDHLGRNCLHNVIRKATKDPSLVIDDILKRFPDLINVCTNDMETPLHLVIALFSSLETKFSIVELIEKMRKAGADVYAIGKEGVTPFDDIFFYSKVDYNYKLSVLPELKIDKCKDQGHYIIQAICANNAVKDSFFMEKLLEIKGWGLIAQQSLLYFACVNAEEELLEKILAKWAVIGSKNDFINIKLYEYPILKLFKIKDLINNRPKQKRMINSLLKYTKFSKSEDLKLNSKLIKCGYHDILKAKGFKKHKCTHEFRKEMVEFLLMKIKEGADKQDYIETVKLVYQAGDEIKAELQSVYVENVK